MVELGQKVSIKKLADPKAVDIQQDPFHPTAYIITLPLDSEPSYIWQTLFQQELWASLDFWDRKVLVVGKALKLVTTQDRVPEKLQWLEGVVVATNKRVDDYNKEVKAEKRERTTKVIAEDNLRKDVTSWELGRVRG